MTAKLNRAVRCTAAVLAAVAIGAGATACDSSGDSSSKAAGSHSDTALNLSSSGKQGGSQDKAGSDNAGTDNAGSGNAGSDKAGTQESSGTPARTTAQQGSRTDAVNPVSTTSTTSRCHTNELGYTWGGPHGGRPDMNTTYQQQVTIRLTNKSTHTCTLRGYPGVQLVSTTGETWDLLRSSDMPSTLTLKPGDDTAMVSMSILPAQKNDPDVKPFVPAQILLTPPNETTHATLAWPYGGAILDQSGASRPGTFVNPVGIG
ncbi:DUF4232 domain-containing protein [Streptomyces sp. NPDC049954]|uniref:DUF4232 domain-containing protein n=1 Tax=Streptomyces sp. NPDC049954 TaxID=3155779 RepID=UPI00341E7216